LGLSHATTRPTLVRSLVRFGQVAKPRSAARARTTAFRSDALRKSSAYTRIVTCGFACPASFDVVAASSSRSTIRCELR
jgi:hypothetical protein